MAAACNLENSHVSSDTATRSNELLEWRGDNDGPDSVGGVVVRVIDGVQNMVYRQKGQKLLLVSASYMHASMKAPNLMYGGSFSVGILVGSRLSINNKNNDNGHSNNILVNMTVCYAGDAGTRQRPALSGESTVLLSSHGQGCRNKVPGLMNNKCRCADSSVVPNFGDHLSSVIEKGFHEKHALENLVFYACWYETTPSRLAELVGAINTLFAERRRWSKKKKVQEYEGYSECPVTTNIHEREAIDAVVVQLPPMEIQYSGTVPGLCDVAETKKKKSTLIQSLRKMHDRFGPLPVLFLSQTRGIADQGECDRLWGGADCEDGYRKKFTAQTYQFSDGSCLAKPVGCPDVYYFPVCSNSSGVVCAVPVPTTSAPATSAQTTSALTIRSLEKAIFIEESASADDDTWIAGILATQTYLTVGIIVTIMIFRLPRRRRRRLNRHISGRCLSF